MLASFYILFLLPTLLQSQTFRRRSTLVCKNGEVVDGRCACNSEYVGRHCELKKMCETYQRRRNGTCLSCMKGYSGEYCEKLECVNGEADKMGLNCVCNRPYSGPFCADLTTNDVYSFYNSKVYSLGPLGALSLIPLCCIFWGCERMAQKRQIKRVEAMLGDQNYTVQKEALKTLLTEDV